jgi:hypothetical protein
VLNIYKIFKLHGNQTIDVEPALSALFIKYHAVIKEHGPERWLLVLKRSKAAAAGVLTRKPLETTTRNSCCKCSSARESA